MLKNSVVQCVRITLFVGIALIVACMLYAHNSGITLARHSDEQPTLIQLDPRVFAMNAQGQQPLLELHGDVCQVHIQPGKNSLITVHVTVRHYQENPMPAINYSQNSDKNTLSIDEKLPPVVHPQTDSVLVDMTVPEHIDLSSHTEVGNLDISGVSGQLELATATGSITTTGVQFNGQSSLTTNVGTIDFAGGFAPHGKYRMSTHVGSINLTLSGLPSLQVNAQTSIGSIYSDFPSIAIYRGYAQGNLGNAPDASLSLVTGVGSISLI